MTPWALSAPSLDLSNDVKIRGILIKNSHGCRDVFIQELVPAFVNYCNLDGPLVQVQSCIVHAFSPVQSNDLVWNLFWIVLL